MEQPGLELLPYGTLAYQVERLNLIRRPQEWPFPWRSSGGVLHGQGQFQLELRDGGEARGLLGVDSTAFAKVKEPSEKGGPLPPKEGVWGAV